MYCSMPKGQFCARQIIVLQWKKLLAMVIHFVSVTPLIEALVSISFGLLMTSLIGPLYCLLNQNSFYSPKRFQVVDTTADERFC